MIVEGGGMRGIFTAGVLDAFLNASFNPFDMYFGVSSGAATLSSYLARQSGRHFRIFTKFACQPEFMSFRKMMSGGSYMDLDWLWDTVEENEPLNIPIIDQHLEDKECYIVCTGVNTGKPVYLTPKGQNWILYLKASSAIPVLYRNFPYIDNEPMADGGVMDPIPAMAAYNKGAERLIVIRTRPLNVQKKAGLSPLVSTFFLKEYPKLKATIPGQAKRYNKTLGFLKMPPAGIEVIQVAPQSPLKTRRTTKKSSVLINDYLDGIANGMKILKVLNHKAPGSLTQ